MKSKFTYIIILLALATSSVCGQSILFLPTGVKHSVRLVNEEIGKEVIILPMSHTKKPAFFKEVRDYLDSLKNNGYVVFYEGVAINKNMDSVKLDTLYRKFRKVVRYDISSDYTDRNNKSVPKMYQKRGYVMQTTAILGLTTEKDINVDIPFQDLIKMYEDEYGEIVLTDCDLSTELNAKYKCKKSKEYPSYAMLSYYREKHIKKSVQESEHKKIVLLYGGGHKHRLSLDFRCLLGYKKAPLVRYE